MLDKVVAYILGMAITFAYIEFRNKEDLLNIKKALQAECNQKVIDSWKIYRGVDIEASNKNTR